MLPSARRLARWKVFALATFKRPLGLGIVAAQKSAIPDASKCSQARTLEGLASGRTWNRAAQKSAIPDASKCSQARTLEGLSAFRKSYVYLF